MKKWFAFAAALIIFGGCNSQTSRPKFSNPSDNKGKIAFAMNGKFYNQGERGPIYKDPHGRRIDDPEIVYKDNGDSVVYGIVSEGFDNRVFKSEDGKIKYLTPFSWFKRPTNPTLNSLYKLSKLEA